MSDVVSPLFNEEETAAYLRVAVATLRRWRWAGKPPAFVKIGGLVRYEPPVVKALVRAGRRTSTTDPGPQEAESPAS